MSEPLNPHLHDYYNRREAAERDIGAVVASLVAQGAGGATSGITEVANQGFYQETLGGAVYWSFGTGAHFIDRRILDRYRQLGGDISFLGYPVTHNAFAADGVGMFSRFKNGVIYWHPDIGAFEVHGAILGKWSAMGAEQGVLGYPISDETPTQDGIGRFSQCQRGVIYWSPDTGAFETHGAIRDRWLSLGAEKSYLGYPISDEGDMPSGGGRTNRFQNGSIFARHNGEILELPDQIVLEGPLVTEETVGGWHRVVLDSSGNWSYEGHLHNSGFFGLSVGIGTVLHVRAPDGTAFAFGHEDSLDGTVSPGSRRDTDWKKAGNHPGIRAVWPAIRSTGYTTKIDIGMGVGQIIELVMSGLFVVGTAFFWLSGGDKSSRTCPDGTVVFYNTGDTPPECP
ncbi:MAG TPA: hypothetical protein VII06_41765 [Chloroflexota bacterium]|jgi:hypothetical protein